MLCTGNKKDGTPCKNRVPRHHQQGSSNKTQQTRCYQHFDHELEARHREQEIQLHKKQRSYAREERQRQVQEYLAKESYQNDTDGFINGLAEGETCLSNYDSDLDIVDHGVGVCDKCGNVGYTYLLSCGEAFCVDSHNETTDESCCCHHVLYCSQHPLDLY